jgi:glycosyltransferase involved in cell wall biosynthesis
MIGQRETGNERYTLNLIAGLAQVDAESRYLLLVTDPAPLQRALTLPPNFAILPVRPAANSLRLAWAMPRACRHGGAQVLHVSYTAPPFCSCPTVVTVHDISYESFPHFFSLRDRLLLSITVPLSCRRAARVIAVSEWTKRDLVQRYGIAAEKIRVIHEAADERFNPGVPAGEVVRVRAQHVAGQRYILAVGNLQPRKNLARLVDAFAALIADGAVEEDLVLAIAGQVHWRGSTLYQAVEAQGMQQRVRFLGYVPDEDLPALYRGAVVFAHPALYEGFGLPPLEAMACGTPVVCSNAASLPEVVGEAAVLFDPQDTGALSRALRDLLGDEERRRALASAGQARAAQFSWQRAARETVAVYREAAGA